MPLLRRRVNKTSKEISHARKADKSVVWQSSDGPAGMMDIGGIHRVRKAEKKYESAMNARSKGPVGAIRLALASKEAKNKLANIKRIKDLRSKGYTVEAKKSKIMVSKKPKLVYDESVKHLMGNIIMGETVSTVSKRGNVRNGKLIAAENGFVIIEINGAQVPLKANRLEKVTKLK